MLTATVHTQTSPLVAELVGGTGSCCSGDVEALTGGEGTIEFDDDGGVTGTGQAGNVRSMLPAPTVGSVGGW